MSILLFFIALAIRSDARRRLSRVDWRKEKKIHRGHYLNSLHLNATAAVVRVLVLGVTGVGEKYIKMTKAVSFYFYFFRLRPLSFVELFIMYSRLAFLWKYRELIFHPFCQPKSEISSWTSVFIPHTHSVSLSFRRNGHMLTHRHKKPFECKADGCGKSYCDARSLRRHTENHHVHPSLPISTPTISVQDVISNTSNIPSCIHYAPKGTQSFQKGSVSSSALKLPNTTPTVVTASAAEQSAIIIRKSRTGTGEQKGNLVVSACIYLYQIIY